MRDDQVWLIQPYRSSQVLKNVRPGFDSVHQINGKWHIQYEWTTVDNIQHPIGYIKGLNNESHFYFLNDMRRPKIPDLHFQYHCSAHNTFITEGVSLEFAKLSLLVLASSLPEQSIFMVELDRFTMSTKPVCKLMHDNLPGKPPYDNMDLTFAQRIYKILRERKVKVIVTMDVKKQRQNVLSVHDVAKKEKRGEECHDKLLYHAKTHLGEFCIPRDLLNVQTVGGGSSEDVNLFFHGIIEYELEDDHTSKEWNTLQDSHQTPSSYHHSACFTFDIQAKRKLFIRRFYNSETLEQGGYTITVKRHTFPKGNEHSCNLGFHVLENERVEIQISHLRNFRSCGLLQQTRPKTITELSDGILTIFAGRAENRTPSSKTVPATPLTRAYKGSWNSHYNTCNFMSFDVGNRKERHMLTRAALLKPVGESSDAQVQPGVPQSVVIQNAPSLQIRPRRRAVVSNQWSIQHLTYHNGCWLFVANHKGRQLEIPCKMECNKVYYDQTCVSKGMLDRRPWDLNLSLILRKEPVFDKLFLDWKTTLNEVMKTFPVEDLPTQVV